MSGDLDERLLAAHADDDKAALVTLYAEAADASDDPVRSGFYLTHAWVFALETGDKRAEEYRNRLAEDGRVD